MRIPIHKPWFWFLWYGAVIGASFLLGGCTILKYEDDTHSLTIADLRISGSAIDLNAVLEGKGSLSVNREQGSAEGIVDTVADAVSVNPLD